MKRNKLIAAALALVPSIIVLAVWAARPPSQETLPPAASATATTPVATPVTSTSPSTAPTQSAAVTPTPSVSASAPSTTSSPATPPPSSPSSPSKKPTTPAGEEAIVGGVLVTLPPSYYLDQGNGVEASFVGTTDSRPRQPAILRMTSIGFKSLPTVDQGLVEGRCPMQPHTASTTIAGRKAEVTRNVYRCPEGTWTYVNWVITDPRGPKFQADYFGLFDRRPQELTDAFAAAKLMPGN